MGLSRSKGSIEMRNLVWNVRYGIQCQSPTYVVQRLQRGDGNPPQLHQAGT